MVVFPVDTLGKDIPWLPTEKSNRPGVNYVSFNNLLPPFNNPLVRRAFAQAIDRQVLVEMVRKYYTKDPKPATSLTPPEIMGRDLYKQVGALFDPQEAKDLLKEAGFSDSSPFPDVTMIVNAYGDVAPGARFNMANAMVEMWQEHLGVTVQVEVIAAFKDYGNRLKTDPPEIFWQGWVADINDPDNFLRELFHSDSEYNYGHFKSPEFDQLVENASQSKNPAERQELYIQAERFLCEVETGLIPLYHYTFTVP
jgi:oligopeptide transport system substrate-binding protein